jgi:glycosyltransferase involved in cell wall biosynthesis
VKILFYNHTGKVSGGERVLGMIVSGLNRQRFESVVMCPEDGPLAPMMAAGRVRTIVIDALVARFTWRPKHLIHYLASFVRLMRTARVAAIAEQPDLIHANSIRSGLVMTIATAGLKVPVIWHVHDLLPRHPLSTAIRFVATASRNTYVIAVSEAVAKRFRGAVARCFPRRLHMRTIHNAVDVEKFYPHSLKRDETRRSLGFAEHELIVGIVGQLTPRKGQLETIEAFVQVTPKFPEAKLIIVGEALFNRDSEYADKLQDAAERLGISDRVLFVGQREDITELTRAFDLAIVNSRAEPFGLTVVEAMASGTPVLATAVDGIREIIKHGQTGWLVRSGECQELVQGIELLLADQGLRTQLSTAALTTVRSRFAAEAFISNLEKLYGSISLSSSPHQAAHSQKLEVKLSAD